MNAVMKNQTVKKKYTVIVLDEDGYELDRQSVNAENIRDALKLVENLYRSAN